jgi:predicted DNA-binding transcriptional regulator YafY
MRADRLLSLLMILQTRGKKTAQQLATELEVSERTIYRDIDALSTSGVPVYGDRGPDGGYALLDSYRTHLTGLTQDQVRALFMLSIPAPLNDLGISQELKGALLKLSAALPEAQRADREKAQKRIHLDSTRWSGSDEPGPHLHTIHQAVWQDRKLRIRRRLYWGHWSEIEQVVEPYGLVAKADRWYLVCAREGRIDVRRVSHLLDAQMTEEPFERPPDFDLATFWRGSCAEFERSRPTYPVIARIAPHFVNALPWYFGNQIRHIAAQAGPPDEAGWVTLELPFESLEAARQQILGFGGAVEVLEPKPLRLSIVDYANQILKQYG